MKLFIESCKYIGKNFMKMFFMALIPSFVIALIVDLSAYFDHFVLLGAQNENAFVYSLMMAFKPCNSLLFLLIIIVSFLLFTLVVSVLTTSIDKHLKGGKFYYGALGNRISEGIIMVLPALLILILPLILLNIIVSAIMELILFILPVVYPVLSYILYFASLYISLELIRLQLTVIPNLLMFGYRLNESLSSSVKLSEKAHFSMLLAIFLPGFLAVLFSKLFSLLIPSYIVSVIFIMLMIMYYSALIMITFYEYNNLDRKDTLDKYGFPKR